MKPFVLLDVDGMLNVLASAAKRKELVYHQGWIKRWSDLGSMGLFRLTLNPTIGARLRFLAQETGAELAWATTWNEAANYYVGPHIGLPELPVLRVANPHAKAATVVPATEGRPFVWFDDDTTLLAGCDRACRASQRWNVILTDPEVGITDAHIAEAKAWLDAL